MLTLIHSRGLTFIEGRTCTSLPPVLRAAQFFLFTYLSTYLNLRPPGVAPPPGRARWGPPSEQGQGLQSSMCQPARGGWTGWDPRSRVLCLAGIWWALSLGCGPACLLNGETLGLGGRFTLWTMDEGLFQWSEFMVGLFFFLKF